MSFTKGIVSNGLATIVQKLVRIADQLLLVPFFLHNWGAATYGEWLTLTIIPSILSFSDLGLGSAVSNSFVLSYAAGDRQKAADIKRAGFCVVSLSVVFGIILTIFVLLICLHLGAFDKSHIPASEAVLVVVFMMAAKLVAFYNQVVEGFFRAARRAAWGSLIGSGTYLASIIVGLIILHLGGGLATFAFAQLVVSLLFAAFYFALGSSLVDLANVRGRLLRSDLLSFAKKGVGYMMTPIWQSIYFQGSTFVVRLTLGAEAVALFNTVRTVCRSVNQIFSIINASIFPDLQYEWGRGNVEVVRKCFRIAVLLSMIAGLAGFVILVFFGLGLYGWWTRSIITVPHDVWTVFMLGVLLNAVWWTSVVTYRMTNQPYHFAIASTTMAMVSVGLTYILAYEFGLLGAAIGSVAFEFVMAIYVLPDSCRLLGMRVSDLFADVAGDFHSVLSKIKKGSRSVKIWR